VLQPANKHFSHILSENLFSSINSLKVVFVGVWGACGGATVIAVDVLAAVFSFLIFLPLSVEFEDFLIFFEEFEEFEGVVGEMEVEGVVETLFLADTLLLSSSFFFSV